MVQVMKKYLTKCDSRFKTAKIVDASVLRFKSAVTLFAPGSHQHMPTTKTSFANAFMAGDWLQQGPGSHGARGLSQEKAFVTGILAANEVARSQAVNAQAKVIEVEEDSLIEIRTTPHPTRCSSTRCRITFYLSFFEIKTTRYCQTIDWVITSSIGTS
jgi:uncharacterized protein with NAD-binding domain and iron-sulfur cluster